VAEGLHGLRIEAGFDPARDREMPQRMPIEAGRRLRVALRVFGMQRSSLSNIDWTSA
jgi:hypothetical protein